MQLPVFGVENWLNCHEKSAKYDIAGVSISAFTLEEVIALGPKSQADFLKDLSAKKLDYGWIEGAPAFKKAAAALYCHQDAENILQTNGATGANFLALYSLLEPGDHVISLYPTYQQLYDIPKSLGCQVSFWLAKEEENWLPSLVELRELIQTNTKMICINNANNPTGAVMDRAYLKELVEIASQAGAYILSDEIYRPLHPSCDVPAICDLYQRGISTNSLSKTYSIPGIRVGWIVAHLDLIEVFRHYRDYTMICAGVFDDMVATYALENQDKILERNSDLLKTNLQVLTRWVEQEEQAHFVAPAFVPTSFVGLDLPLDLETFCLELLKEKGVLLVPGTCFGYKNYVRIGYCCDSQTLQRALALLSEFIQEIMHKSAFSH